MPAGIVRLPALTPVRVVVEQSEAGAIEVGIHLQQASGEWGEPLRPAQR